MKAADVLDKVLLETGKFHLVTDDAATVLIPVEGEWWLIRAERSDKEGRHVR